MPCANEDTVLPLKLSAEAFKWELAAITKQKNEAFAQMVEASAAEEKTWAKKVAVYKDTMTTKVC